MKDLALHVLVVVVVLATPQPKLLAGLILQAVLGKVVPYGLSIIHLSFSLPEPMRLKNEITHVSLGVNVLLLVVQAVLHLLEEVGVGFTSFGLLACAELIDAVVNISVTLVLLYNLGIERVAELQLITQDQVVLPGRVARPFARHSHS